MCVLRAPIVIAASKDSASLPKTLLVCIALCYTAYSHCSLGFIQHYLYFAYIDTYILITTRLEYIYLHLKLLDHSRINVCIVLVILLGLMVRFLSKIILV